MAGVYGKGQMPLVKYVLSADKTLSYYEAIAEYNTYINSGTDAWTLTLPTPTVELVGSSIIKCVNSSTANFTLACSSGFVAGGSSFILNPGDSADVRVVPNGATTYAWEVKGASQAVTGLSETVFDIVAASFAAGTHTNVTITKQDTDNSFDVAATGMDVASTDITDWQTAVEQTVGTCLETNSTHKGLTVSHTAGTPDTINFTVDSFARVATALTGGAAGALDAFDGNDLANGEFELVVASGVVSVYKVNTTGGQVESSPTVIVPDTNPGTINHELQAFYVTAAGVTGFDEAAMDAVTTMIATNGSHTGLTATADDAGDGLDLAVTYGTASATACVGNDARLPVDWASWTPSAVVWSGGAPASVTEVYRNCTVNDTVRFKAIISTADGDGKTLTSIALGTTPANIGGKVRVYAIQTINGTESDAMGYIDTAGDGLLKFDNAAAWTDGTACSIEISGEFEV